MEKNHWKLTTAYGRWSWVEETTKKLSVSVFQETLWGISTGTTDLKWETTASNCMPTSPTAYMERTEYLKVHYQTGVRQEWMKIPISIYL